MKALFGENFNEWGRHKGATGSLATGMYEQPCLLAKGESPRSTSRHGIIERPVRIATKSARRTKTISMIATVDHGPGRLRNRHPQKSNFGVNGGRHRQGIAVEAASGTPMRKADESAAR
jgi:hypothetical protein